MSDILFSIIIPTYNRADFIISTLDTVLHQSYPHVEVIIVDDGSTDNTAALVSPYLSEKVYYFKKENEERAAARNFGIHQAKGHYVTFIDSDDILYPWHFASAVKMIEKYQNPEIFHLAYEIKDTQGNILYQNNQLKGDLNRKLLKGNLLSCMGVFVRKDIILQNLFNPTRDLSGSEDWELWMRIASKYPIYYNNEITSALIQHDKRSVLDVKEEKLKKRIDLAYEAVSADPDFQKKYGKYKNLVRSHLLLYIALHLLIALQKKRCWRYVMESVRIYPGIIFNKKFLVIVFKTLSNF
ncbi:MAG: glycosyltransferase family A protein [Microscillaceae bacterium]|nr:glycosyltransferase family A protein [Microscillaceae bacterium]